MTHDDFVFSVYNHYLLLFVIAPKSPFCPKIPPSALPDCHGVPFDCGPSTHVVPTGELSAATLSEDRAGQEEQYMWWLVRRDEY